MNPNLQNLTWQCFVCGMQKPDRLIKFFMHDISKIKNLETGTIIFNCRYCADNKACEEKSSNTDWVMERFIN